jgi:hypothetical protein
VSNTNGTEERLVIVSSDGHIGPPGEQYREYFDPKYVADFDEWWSEYIPAWMTKGTKARGSEMEPAPTGVNMWGEEYKR